MNKTIHNDLIYDYPVLVLPDCEYPNPHVVRLNDKWQLIAGNKFTATKSTVAVNHGELPAKSIAALQIILSYGLPVKLLAYRKAVLMLMQHDAHIRLPELCSLIHVSDTWVRQILGLYDMKLGSMVLANAYTLNKLPGRDELMWEKAMYMHPTEFIPQCYERMKELRSEFARTRKGRGS